MGKSLSSPLKRLNCKKEVRIFIFGLDGAGKTMILEKIKLGEIESMQPAVGFHIETVGYKNVCLISWNLGISDLPLHRWNSYFENTKGLIYVIDSNNEQRMPEAKKEFDFMLKEEKLKDAVLLVFANKQDLPNAMSINDLAEQLGLKSLQGRRWHIQRVSAKNGDGLYEGFDWMAKKIAKNL